MPGHGHTGQAMLCVWQCGARGNAGGCWEMAEESIEPLIYSKCQINITAKISDQDVTFIVDTGAQTNVMTLSIALKLGLEPFIDKKMKQF